MSSRNEGSYPCGVHLHQDHQAPARHVHSDLKRESSGSISAGRNRQTDLHQFDHVVVVQFLQDGDLPVHLLQRQRGFRERIRVRVGTVRRQTA